MKEWFQQLLLRRRLSDLEAWMHSCNGDHRPEINQKVREEIVFLRVVLAHD